MAVNRVISDESGGVKKKQTYTFSASNPSSTSTTPRVTTNTSPRVPAGTTHFNNVPPGVSTPTVANTTATIPASSGKRVYRNGVPEEIRNALGITNNNHSSAQPEEMTEEEKAASEAEKKAAEEAAAAAELESRTFGIPTNRDLGRPNYTYTDVATPNRSPQQSWQGRDMYSALLALQDQYNRNMAGAGPKTEAEIQQQAGADYASYYDQLRRAAANQYALQDLSYLQQLQGIQNSYDKNREASARNYAQNYSQADRQLLSRGMQRSSYGAQTLANIARQGAEAQQAIWDQQVQSENNVDAMRQQLLANYANTQQGYDAGQASDVLSRIWGLRDTEYDRQVNRANTLNQLATQLYGYLNGINEVGREQFNTENTLRENQHQFDTNVAETRQGVLDTRVNSQMDNDLKWAQLQEQAYQYANGENWDEAKFRFQNPGYAFTRAEDGRLVMPKASTIGARGPIGWSGPDIVIRPTYTAPASAAGAAGTGTTGTASPSSGWGNSVASVISQSANAANGNSSLSNAAAQGWNMLSGAVNGSKLTAYPYQTTE